MAVSCTCIHGLVNVYCRLIFCLQLVPATYLSSFNGMAYLHVTYIMPFKHKISLVEHDKHHLTQNL